MNNHHFFLKLLSQASILTGFYGTFRGEYLVEKAVRNIVAKSLRDPVVSDIGLLGIRGFIHALA